MTQPANFVSGKMKENLPGQKGGQPVKSIARANRNDAAADWSRDRERKPAQ
jgi:hypothetical protein